ncbi:MAG: transporter [Candidatus Omnitrophota bacterium]
MKKIFTFLTVLTYMAWPCLSFAARPLSMDDIGTVEERHIGIESGFEYVKQPDEERNFSLVVKYGLTKNIDIGMETPYQFIDFKESANVDGIGDVKLCTKYRFLEEGDLPGMALSFSIKTESGDEEKGLGSGEADYSVTGLITKEIGAFTTHLNLGYTFVGEPGDDNLLYGIALEYPLNESLNIVGEVAGETVFDGDFDDNLFSGLLGANYSLNEIAALDLGIGFQISEASPDYKIVAGLSLEL